LRTRDATASTHDATAARDPHLEAMPRLHLARVLFAVVVTTSVATADPPKRPAIKVDVELSARSKPAERAADASPSPSGLTADAVMAVELLTSPIHAEQETILKQLIQSTPDSEAEEKSDLYFRLGELYAKQARLHRLQSIELDMKKRSDPSKKEADLARSYIAKAAGAYKELTENPAFVNYKQMDVALFVYAYTLQSGKYFTQARSVYDKLLKNYPASKYVAEAHLSFAEYYWEAGQLDDAEDRYKLVLKSPQSSVYWYAMYKLGWIQLNKKRQSDALETFYRVVQATAKDPKRELLHRNAKKDFVRAFAEVGKADKALVAFRRVDASGAYAMLETLAGFYMDQGKSDKAIFTYRELMKHAPKNPNVCMWQYEIAHAMLSLPGATTATKINEIADLNKLYRALAGKKVLPAAQATECRDNAAAMSGELARAYHNEYNKTLAHDSFSAASKLYATYLETFKDAPDAPSTRYFHAELLWMRAEREKDARLRTELFEQSAAAFIEVVKEGKVEPKQLNESAFAAASALLYAHESDPRTPTAKLDGNDDDNAPPKPRPLPAREQRMIEAFDLYLARTKSPPLDELVNMKFYKANVLRRFDHLDEAIPLFKDILAKHSDHRAAEDAALLLVDIYIRMGDEPALLALTDQLLGNKKLLADNDEDRKKLEAIKRKALRRGVEKIEARARKDKNLALFVECGNAYLAIYNIDPEADANDEVLYNAGVCFEDGRSLGAAMDVYRTLQRYYPKSKLSARATARLGRSYADMAKYGEAAQTLEQYAKKYAGETDAFDAMSDAVFFYKGVGNDAKAIEDTRYFVRTYGAKKPAEAAAAAFSLTAIYEKQGDADALIKHLRAYIRDHGSKGGAARLVTAHSKLGLTLLRASCPVTGVDGACVKVIRERATRTVASTSRASRVQKTQCGPDSKVKLTVLDRDARRVRDARTALAAAGREYAKLRAATPDFEKAIATNPELAIARHQAAEARLAEATLDLEAYFGLAFPTNLDFDPRQPAVAKKSLARFDAWFANKEAAGKRAAEKLSTVLELTDNAASIAAVARLGQIAQNFADSLFTAEIPKNLRTGPFAEDKVEAYCDTLTEKAEPLADRAVAAFGTCLAKSTELGWFSEWSQLCERELGQIKPEEFPTASERRSEADRVASLTVLAPVANLD
jgi:TolA-binding protein